MVSGPRDPKNRVRHQILRILVVGELRGMSFSDLMQNCATNRLRQVLLAPTISLLKRSRIFKFACGNQRAASRGNQRAASRGNQRYVEINANPHPPIPKGPTPPPTPPPPPALGDGLGGGD